MNKEKFNYEKHCGFNKGIWDIEEINKKEVKNERNRKSMESK